MAIMDIAAETNDPTSMMRSILADLSFKITFANILVNINVKMEAKNTSAEILNPIFAICLIIMPPLCEGVFATSDANKYRLKVFQRRFDALIRTPQGLDFALSLGDDFTQLDCHA